MNPRRPTAGSPAFVAAPAMCVLPERPGDGAIENGPLITTTPTRRGWFVTGNCVTFFHPFYTPPSPNLRRVVRLPARQRARVLQRYAVESRLDHLKAPLGWKVARFLRRLTTTK